jgi:hypothetical protein
MDNETIAIKLSELLLDQSGDKDDLIKNISSRYSEQDDLDPNIVLYLCRRKDIITQHMLNYFISLHPYAGFLFNIKDLLLLHQANSDGYTIFVRFLTAYQRVEPNILTEDGLEEISQFIDNNELAGPFIDDMKEFVYDTIVDMMPDMPAPNYIIPKPQSGTSPDVNVITTNQIDGDKLKSAVDQTFAQQGLKLTGDLDFNNLVEHMTTVEKDNIYNILINRSKVMSMRLDPELIRKYGPVNVQQAEDNIEDIKLGGPRMLIDTQHEYDQEGESRLDYWFSGRCGYCSRRITKPQYATRIPIITGGWKGCFCSWDHVLCQIQAPIDGIEGDEDTLIKLIGQQRFDRIKAETALAELYEEILIKYGLYDDNDGDQ